MGKIGKLGKDFRLALRLCKYSKSFKADFIAYAIFELIFLICITSDALHRGNGELLFLGIFFGMMAPLGATGDFHSVLFSDFLISSQLSKKLQIAFPHLLSVVGVFLGFTLAVLIELILGKGERGDVIAFLAVGMGFYMLFMVTARKEYCVMILLVALFVTSFFSGAIAYFAEGKLYSVLTQMTRDYLAYFKDKQLEATVYGYGILLLFSILSWWALRLLWKYEGSGFYRSMREKVI